LDLLDGLISYWKLDETSTTIGEPTTTLTTTPAPATTTTYHTTTSTTTTTGDDTPKAQYTDDFSTYTDGILFGQGNWISGLNRVDKLTYEGDSFIYGNSSGSVCAAIYNQTFANDQYAQIVSIYPSTTRASGIGVRMSGSANTFCGYGFYVMGGAQRLFKVVNGVKTDLGSVGTEAIANTDVWKLEISGTTLTAYKNGSVYTAVGTNGQATVTDFASGKAGYFGYGSEYDAGATNWEGGDL
jgi:hypothetical protein